MTIIKQTGVSNKSHQRNLRAYINDDRKVLLRGSQNMDHCTNIKRWASFMEATRHKYGHDKAARHIRDKKTGELVEAKNTIMFHQILAFLPEECDINGGKLTPEDCMKYAKEYVAAYYPHQEVVMALHNEYCKADKTHRYAVHIVINRTDLETGKRLDEGRGKTAKMKRANRIRDMDSKWGLKQVKRDEANSTLHKRQPSKAEKEIGARGGQSYKRNLRELCRIAAGRAESVYDFRSLLEQWGVDTQFRNGRMYVTDTDNARYSFSVVKLDAALSPEGLAAAFRENVAASIRKLGEDALGKRTMPEKERARIEGLKKSYLSQIRDSYMAYRKEVHAMQGSPLADIPKLKLTRPPEELAKDAEIQRTILAYWRGADELRVRAANDGAAIRKPGQTPGVSAGVSKPQASRPVPAADRDDRATEQGNR